MAKQIKRRPNRRKDTEFPGVSFYKDRHGTVRWRYRADNGSTVNLGTEYGTPEFIEKYRAAAAGERLPAAVLAAYQAPVARTTPGKNQHSLRQVADNWYQSAQFRRLAEATSSNYRRITEGFLEEHGALAVEELNRAAVMRFMQAKADRPEAANGLLRVLRLMLDHAKEVLEYIEHNPTRDVLKFQSKNKDGYHTWTEEEIARFFEFWPENSTADTAMSLMLYTGAARADAVKLGPKNLHQVGENTRLHYYRQKMQTRGGVLIDIPLHSELARRLAQHDPAVPTFLQTERGTERSAAGLGNAMRMWCDAAGLPQCTAHGLRKACARRLADAGASPHEIMAVTGHQTLAEIGRYIEKVARANLADRAMGRI